MREDLNKTGEMHFVVTRFNVNIDTVKTKDVARINPAIDVDYLDRRFVLFETYTVPSMRQQTNQNFIWVVLFHADTPQQYKDRLSQLKGAYPQFHPLYVPHEKDHMAALNEYLLAFDAKRYIISRVDNDDAFHLGFIQQTQEVVASEQENEYVIIFPYGVQYHESRRIATKYMFPLNHFSTLVTPNAGDGQLKSIITYNHMEVGEFFTLKQIMLDKPMWLEVIHDYNISNRMHVKHRYILRDRAVLDGFGVPLPIARNAYVVGIFYAVFQRPINLMRLLKMYGVKGFFVKVVGKIQRR